MTETTDRSRERPLKRPRTSSPENVASNITLLRIDGNAVVASDHNNVANLDTDPTRLDQDIELTQAELDEKWRIYEMISEEYHDIVTELPLDYQRTFMLVKELDDEQQSHTATLKKSLTNYFKEPPSSCTHATRADQYRSIHKDYVSTTRACEDKINLALTLYESVDRHIQRLDKDLAVYEDSLVIGLRKGTLPSNDVPSKLHNNQNQLQGAGGIDQPGSGSGEVDDFVQREHEKEWNKIQGFVRKEQQAKTDKEKQGTLDGFLNGGTGVGLIEMPVDINEPRYCYCNEFSRGEMMACENEDCPREWFHLDCLGLTKAPAGEWYCRECAQERAAGDSNASSSPEKDLPESKHELHGRDVSSKKTKKKRKGEKGRKSDGKSSKQKRENAQKPSTK